MMFYNEKEGLKKILILVIFIGFIYISRSLFNLILFTFIFTFLMYSAEQFFKSYMNPKLFIKPKFIVLVLVLLITVGIASGFTNQIAQATTQLTEVVEQVKTYYNQPSTNYIESFIKQELAKFYNTKISNKGVDYIVMSISGVGKVSFNLLISIILAIFFLLERERIVQFTLRFRKSKIAIFYNEIEYFGKVFTRSFGKVIETQIIIAAINGLLSTITLWFMGFPHVLGLGIMILILGFIPVLGVIISLIPLCIIALTTGGVVKVISVLIMIAVLHTLESYILNPKLMSSKTKLPVFYIFVILLISEHFFGTWGLIIGVPAFVFIFELLGVIDEKEIIGEPKHSKLKEKLKGKLNM